MISVAVLDETAVAMRCTADSSDSTSARGVVAAAAERNAHLAEQQQPQPVNSLPAQNVAVESDRVAVAVVDVQLGVGIDETGRSDAVAAVRD